MKTRTIVSPFLIGASAAGLAIVLGLPALAGCAKQDVVQPAPTVTEAPSPVLLEDDYVYYPEYEVYFSARLHRYGYREGGRWFWEPAPPHVRPEVLLASPSVRLDFHDSPEHHHDTVIRNYPHNWRPPPGRDRDDHRR